MKTLPTRLVLTILVMLGSLIVQAQTTKKKLTHEEYMTLYGHYLKERAEANLKHLIMDSVLRDQVVIDDTGVKILMPDLKTHSIVMFWEEAPGIIGALEGAHQYDLENLFRTKHHFTKEEQHFYEGTFRHHSEAPTTITGLRVALDPGHFGGTLEEAKREARFVSMSAADAGAKSDIMFFEADLAYATCLLIKKQLIEAGAAEVLITRPAGAGAMGKKFNTWLKDSFYFPGDITSAQSRGEISEARANQFKAALKDTTKEANRNLLFEFYRYLDFRERVIKINQFQPDITLSVHYNASEDAQPSGPKKQVKPTKDNFNMAFIPGAFMNGELAKLDQHIDFLRLLLSPEIQNSAGLSNHILTKQKEILNVDPVVLPETSKLTRSTLPTEFPGVYSRNLYMLRATRSTVSYTESLYQNNPTEARLLSDKSVTVVDGKNEIKTSLRVKQNADAIFAGVSSWVASNKARLATARKN